MRIRLENIRATVLDATDEERSWLAEFLSFSVSGYKRSEDVPMFRDVGRTASFAAGLLPLVQKKAATLGFDVVMHDARTVPAAYDASADVTWLAQHQRDALRVMLEKERGIIRIATSGGKGDLLVAASMVLPCRWLVCCDSFALIDDIANRWEAHNPGRLAGRIGDGRWIEGDGDFICATWQTLASRIKKCDPRALRVIEGAQGFHADECHTVPATQASMVLHAAKNAYYRWGYSGTPVNRSDKRSIYAVGHLGSIIVTVSARALAEAGFSSRCVVRMLTCEQPYVSWEPPAPAYKEQVVRSAARNEVVMQAIQLAERPTLVFFKEIKHGGRLLKMAERAGVRAQISFGEDHTELRRDKLRWLVREGDAVLFVNKTFQKGEVAKEIAQIRDIVNASAGRSTITALQQLGRGMRIDRAADGKVLKDRFTLWDIFDTCEDEPTSALARQARERKNAYRKAGHEVIVE